MYGHIHSKGGAVGYFDFLEKVGDNDYLVRTADGIVCHAIFNPFAGWYVDDLYTVERRTK